MVAHAPALAKKPGAEKSLPQRKAGDYLRRLKFLTSNKSSRQPAATGARKLTHAASQKSGPGAPAAPGRLMRCKNDRT